MDPQTVFLTLAVALPIASGAAAALFLRHAGRAGRRPGLPSLLLGNGPVLLFLLSSAGLVLELYYRHLYDATDTANGSRPSKRWFERYWHVNADGIRDDVDYPRPRDPARRRITFVGDSYTAGHGLRRVEDTFAHRIRAARPGWEVHTLAYNGINTVEEVDLLRRFTARATSSTWSCSSTSTTTSTGSSASSRSSTGRWTCRRPGSGPCSRRA